MDALKNHKENVSRGKDGNLIVTMYAVWDQYPVVDAVDFSILETEIDTVNDSMLLEHAEATDREDGGLAKDGTSLKVIHFDKADLYKLGTTGAVSVTYEATDSVGNVTDYMAYLWVNDKDPQPKVDGYTRAISRKYYNTYKKADYGVDTYRDYGGMYPTSLWYTDPVYKEEIESCFDNIDNDTPDQTWYFTHEQVLKVQKYVKEHDIGKASEEAALKKFYSDFSSCIIQQKDGIISN